MKKLSVEIRKTNEGICEIIVKNDRMNIVSEAIKWLHTHRSFDKEFRVEIYVTNGYIEDYVGTYFPEYKGTEKEYNAHALYDIKIINGNMVMEHPTRLCK